MGWSRWLIGVGFGCVAVVAFVTPPMSSLIHNWYVSCWPVAGALYIQDLVCGGQYASTITAAIKLGLFEAIDRSGRRGMTADELAIEKALDTRGVEALLNLLASLGLLWVGKGGRYGLRPHARRHLVPGRSSLYLGGIAQCLQHPSVVEAGITLHSALCHGGTVLSAHGVAQGSSDPYWAFHSKHSSEVMEMAAVRLRSVLERYKPGALTFLDVGCGSGVVSGALATPGSPFHAAHFTLMDLRGVVEALPANRFDTVQFRRLPMDFLRGAFPEQLTQGQRRHDVVLMFNFLEHFNEEEIVKMVKRVWAECTNPGAALIVGEPVLPGDQGGQVFLTSPMPHMFHMLLYSWTPEGRLRSEEGWQRLLLREGLCSSVHTVRVPFIPFVYFVCFKV